MVNKFEEIYSLFMEPTGKYGRVRDTPTYPRILALYSEIFCRKLAVFLLDKMKQGHFKAFLMFYDLMKTKGFPVPNHAVLIKNHSGNDDRKNYYEELLEVYKEKGWGNLDSNIAHSIFRGERISNSERFANISLPDGFSFEFTMEDF